MARMKFLCDAERCINCNSCVVSCNNEHDIPWGINRRHVITLRDGEAGEKSVSVACMHCTDAPCAAVCPVDCCVPNPERTESEDVLLARAKEIHPEKEFSGLTASNSHFRKG